MTFKEYFDSPRGGIGWILALVVLILCIVIAVVGGPLTTTVILGLIGALALSRIV